jgi:hypothetical protein
MKKVGIGKGKIFLVVAEKTDKIQDVFKKKAQK